MKKSTFAAQMLSLYGKPWIATLAAIALPAAAASFLIDIRWAIVFLMILFLVVPMLFFFLYFYYGLLPVCVMNVMPHRLKIGPESVRADIYQSVTDEQTGEERIEILSTMDVPYRAFRNYHTGLSSVVFPMHGGMKGFIWIPMSAFPDSDRFAKAIGMITDGIRKHTVEL